MSRYLILLFSCLLFHKVFSQKQIAEIELPSPGVKNLAGIVCGDSILFTYYRSDLDKTASANFNTVWIYPDGSQKRIDVKELAGKLLIGVVHKKDSIQYYFLEESKKKIEVGMLTYHKDTNKKGTHSNRITLPGKLLGCYVEKNLFLIYATKEESAVRILKINNLVVVQEQKFSDSFDWEKLKGKKVTFIDGGVPMRNSQIITPIRVIKQDSSVFVISDHPAYTEPVPLSSYKTYISKLDLKTNTSASKVFFEPSRADFKTMVKDNKVFRFVPRKDLEVSIYDFETRTLLNKIVLAKKEKRDYYIRSGKRKEIEKIKVNSWLPLNSLIAVDSSPSGYILTLGGYTEEDPNVPFMGGLGLIPASISALANAVVHELNDGPMSYSYFYLEVTKDGSGNKLMPHTGLLKQRIDDYELSVASKMIYKSYIDTPNAIYAFYVTKGNSNIQVMKFD